VSYFGRIASRVGAPAARRVAPSASSQSPVARADQRLNLLGDWELPMPAASTARPQRAGGESLEAGDLEAGDLNVGALAPDSDSGTTFAGEPAVTNAPARGGTPAAARKPAPRSNAFDADFPPTTSAPPAPATSAGQVDRAGHAGRLPPSLAEPPAASPREHRSPAGSPPVSPLLAQSQAMARTPIDSRPTGAADDRPTGTSNARRSPTTVIDAEVASTSAAPRGALSSDEAAAAVSRAATPASPVPAAPEPARRAEAGPTSAMQALSEALSKVNAWMARPIEPRRLEPAPSMISAAAPLPATPADAGARHGLDGDAAAAPVAPRLSIGHLEVEVVPPPPEPVRAPAARAQRAPSHGGLTAVFAAAEIAKLSFGTRGR